MIEKYIDLGAYDRDGEPRVQLLFPSTQVKIAAANVANLHPAIARFRDTVRPTPDGVYILLNAMGSTEFYGQNNNGDIFYERDLNHAPPGWDSFTPEQMRDAARDWPFGYPTFLNAHLFVRHKNKDPGRSTGRVIIAVWNARMHRVDLVVFADRRLSRQFDAYEFLEAVDRGEFPAVSMGTRVVFDVCSWCGNQAKVESDYCECIRRHKGEIAQGRKGVPDGVQCGMINPKPRMFDISWVPRGADKTARMLMKIASDQREAPATRAAAKLALEKRIPVMGSEQGKLGDLEKREPAFPTDVLNRLGSRGLPKALSSTGMSGIVLRPQEYQRIVLISIGRPDIADDLDARGVTFPEVDEAVDMHGHVDPAEVANDVLHLLAARGLLQGRSIAGPALTRRLKDKTPPAQEKQPQAETSPMLKKLAASYNGYRRALLLKVGAMGHFMATNPVVAPQVTGERLLSAFAGGAVKTGASALVPESLVYLTGAHYNDRTKLANTEECRAVRALLGSF